MGKLHKIRKEYNILTDEEKGYLAWTAENKYAISSSASKELRERIRNFRSSWIGYGYYLRSLLKKDGLISRPTTLKVVGQRLRKSRQRQQVSRI